MSVFFKKFNMKSAQKLLREHKLSDYGEAQKYVDETVIRLMSKYTPMDTRATIDSATKLTKIGSGTIEQGGSLAPYATIIYVRPAKFTGSPTRGNYWFERSMNSGGARTIYQGLKRIVGAK